MKLFYTKLLLFAAIFIGSYFFLVHKLAKSNGDYYYPKFTQEAGSLIIGLSRAHYALNPAVLNEHLDIGSKGLPIINFAHNKYISPFGEVYTRAILRKMGKSSDNPLFVISITPGSFIAPKNMDIAEITELDNKTILGKVQNVSSYPNYEYIIDGYELPLYTAFFSNDFSNEIIHPDGWYEIRIKTDSYTIPDSDMRHWKWLQIRGTKRVLKKEVVSEARISSFYKMISELRKLGQVVLIRIPADKDIMEMENEIWPDFDTEFETYAGELNLPFFNYTKDSALYQYLDGSHMVSESSKRFSRKLAEDITKELNRRSKRN